VQQQRREQEAKDELMKDERRRQLAVQMIEQERIAKNELRNSQKQTLLGQI